MSRENHKRLSLTLFFLLLLFFLSLCATASFGTKLVSALPLFSKKNKNPYEVLGVGNSATPAEIKKAFRRLTMEHHPDLKENFEEKEEAKTKMISILAAYEILSDEQRRDEYDRTGLMFGTRAPSPEEFSTLEQLFQFYNMHAPIVSKTKTLESPRVLQQLLDYRGPKVILLQVFGDSMEISRKFSSSWESVTRSPLVAAGLLEMYRIDAFSFKGAPLAAKLGIHVKASSKYLPLLAIVDGEPWKYNSNKAKGEVPVEEEILEFVHSFFYEVSETVEQNGVYTIEDLRVHVMSPLSTSRPVRLLMCPRASDGLLTAVHIRYPQVELIPTTRAVLQKFTEEDCGRPTTIEDRFGDVVSAPELIVALTAPIRSSTANEGDFDSSSELLSSMGDPCSGIEVGASFFLTFEKISKFVESILPPQHSEMGSIAHVDNMNLLRICQGDCLLYFRPYCSASSLPGEAMNKVVKETPAMTEVAVELLRRPYDRIGTGYVCINEHPRLQEALARSISPNHPLAVPLHHSKVGSEESPNSMSHETIQTIREPFFALLLHGDDHQIFPILPPSATSSYSSSYSASVTAMTPTIIDAAIAQLLLSDVEEDENDSDGNMIPSPPPSLSAEITQEIKLIGTNANSVGLGQLLYTNGFPMSSNQRYSIMSTRLINRLRPLISKLFPFFMMFFFHKYYLTRKSTVKTINPTGKKMGAIFDDDDLDNALEGHGFLVLVVDKRPAGSGQLTLPSIASDSRFVVRVLGQEHSKWKRWIEREKAKRAPPIQTHAEEEVNKDVGSHEEASSHPKDSKETPKNPNADINILAIRRTRMTGAIKSDTQSAEAFLHDILDSTIPSNIPVPYNALM